MAAQFKYSATLVNLLVRIQTLYTQLETEAEIPSLALRLTKENQLLATHFSTSIEGNPLTQAEVTNIILGDKIPVTKSEKEVKNYFEVLNRISVLAKEEKPLTVELILSLHRDLMKNLLINNPGKFRDEAVVVGQRIPAGTVLIKHNPPSHNATEIEKYLSKLFVEIEDDKQTHSLIKAGLLHHGFVYIHPFADGNGRMARILTTYYLLLNGYRVTKYFVLDDYYDIDRIRYSDMLHSADSGKKTIWLEYFLEGIAFSLQAALKRVETIKGQEIDNLTGVKRVLVSRREEEVLQLIIEKKVLKSKDLVEIFNVTRQQAQSLLNSLVKKGVIKKLGKTKLSYYKLAK